MDQVEGLSPSKEKHQFYMSLEPTTSVPLDVAARLQLNIMIEPYDYINIFADVPRVFLPVLWFEQHVIMPPELAGEIGQALTIPSIVRVCGIIMVVFGVVLLLWTPVERVFFRRRRIAGTIGNKDQIAFNGVRSFNLTTEKGLLGASEKQNCKSTTATAIVLVDKLLEKPEKVPLTDSSPQLAPAEPESAPLIEGRNATIVKS
uniref:Scavenger receptor class B member 1 n=1 Tax=Anopheles maculatus TaxID=74869 RepID=A0A182T085_9DIPT